MSSERKRWEDESSTAGLGIFQYVLGIPNNPFLRKGELSLQQQDRILRGVETIVSRIPSTDYRTISIMPDNTQVLENLQRNIVQGLEQQYLGQQRQNAATHEQLYDLNASSGRLEDAFQNAAKEIINEVIRARKGIVSLNRIQTLQSNYLQNIAVAINTYGSDVHRLLEELAALATEQIRTQLRENKSNREEIRRSIEQAIGQIIVVLQRIESEISSGLQEIHNATLDVRRSVDQVNQTAGDIRNTALDIQQLFDQNNELTREIRDDVHKGIENSQYHVENSELLKARQYLTQGRELLANGHFGEAHSSLLRAFSFQKNHFEINLLLAKSFIELPDAKNARKHLELAGSFSKSLEERQKADITYAEFEKTNGNLQAASEKIIKIITDDPASYYSLTEIMSGMDKMPDLLLALLVRNKNDLNIQAICAIELAKLNEITHAKKAASNLLHFAGESQPHPIIYEKIINSASILIPLLKDATTKEETSIQPASLLFFARILLSQLDPKETELARSYVSQAYKTDPQITNMKKHSDYLGITHYLQSKLGENSSKLKRFGELPSEIRNLL